MENFVITTTSSGKCDVHWTFFDKKNTILANRSITFDSKPTLKEIKERFLDLKNELKTKGAVILRITTLPSGCVKKIKI